MRIYLSGSNAFMSQHLLYGAEVGAPFHQVRGKGMTKGMGGDILFYTCQPHQVLQQQKDHLPAERAASSVEKEDILIAGF